MMDPSILTLKLSMSSSMTAKFWRISQSFPWALNLQMKPSACQVLWKTQTQKSSTNTPKKQRVKSKRSRLSACLTTASFSTTSQWSVSKIKKAGVTCYIHWLVSITSKLLIKWTILRWLPRKMTSLTLIWCTTWPCSQWEQTKRSKAPLNSPQSESGKELASKLKSWSVIKSRVPRTLLSVSH